MVRAPSGSEFNLENPSPSGGEGGTFATDVLGAAYGPTSRGLAPMNPLLSIGSLVERGALNVPPIFESPAVNSAGFVTPEILKLNPIMPLVMNRDIQIENFSDPKTFSSIQRLEELARNKQLKAIETVEASEKHRADFLIKADGTVQLLNNAYSAAQDKSNLVIAVEKPTDNESAIAQKQTVNAFIDQYASKFLLSRNDGGVIAVNDKEKVLSDELKNLLTTPDETGEVFGAEEGRKFQDFNRALAPALDGTASEGTITKEATQRMFRGATATPGDNETSHTVKDVLAFTYSQGKENSESHISTAKNGTILLGTYGLTFKKISDWLLVDELGIPKNNRWKDAEDDEIAEIIKEYAGWANVPTNFKKVFASKSGRKRLAAFLDKLDKLGHGEKLSAKEMASLRQDMKELLPKDLQSKIASDLIKKYDVATGGHHDAGKIALMWALDGKNPQAGKSYQALEQGAKNVANISKARAQNPDQDLSFVNEASKSNDGTPAPSKLSLGKAAERVANRMHRTGRCAAGVQYALQDVGLGQFVGSGDAWTMGKKLVNSRKFVVIDASEAQKDDIVVRRWAHDPNGAGHIAVISKKDESGRLLESSDHTTQLSMSHPRYDKTVFLRYIG
jgi:hypothetical protein